MSALQSGLTTPPEFPTEAFLRAAIRSHFEKAGYQEIAAGQADFACEHSATHEKWILEVIGLTSSVKTDFYTGLGEIVCRMDGSYSKFGLAIPLTSQFLAASRDIHPNTRRALHLHLLFVDASGTVTALKPGQPIPIS